MTLKAKFSIHDVMKVEMQMTAIMPLEDWYKVRETLKADPKSTGYWHPAQELVRMITAMVNAAETSFTERTEKPEDQP